MITDGEAAEIERQRRQGVGGPILLMWVDRLLADRRERIRQLRYLRQRLGQAFRYLDSLFTQPEMRPEGRQPTVARKGGNSSPPLCAVCGKPYARAYGISPAAIAYIHHEGRECRSDSA